MIKRYIRCYRSMNATYEGLEEFLKEVTLEPMLEYSVFRKLQVIRND